MAGTVAIPIRPAGRRRRDRTERDGGEITPEMSREPGRSHPEYWLRAHWLLQVHHPGFSIPATPGNRWKGSYVPSLIDMKIDAYLDYVVNPPASEGDVASWRVDTYAPVGLSLQWWVSRWIGSDPATEVLSIRHAVGEALLESFGTDRGVHARLSAVTKAMVTVRDLSITAADVLRDVGLNLYAEGVDAGDIGRRLIARSFSPVHFRPALRDRAT